MFPQDEERGAGCVAALPSQQRCVRAARFSLVLVLSN